MGAIDFTYWPAVRILYAQKIFWVRRQWKQVTELVKDRDALFQKRLKNEYWAAAPVIVIGGRIT